MCISKRHMDRAVKQMGNWETMPLKRPNTQGLVLSITVKNPKCIHYSVIMIIIIAILYKTLGMHQV